MISPLSSSPLLKATEPARATAATEAPTAAGDLTVSYNSQDRVIMPSQPVVISGTGAGPSVAKARMDGSAPQPTGDSYTFPDHDARTAAAVSFAAVAKTIETFEKAYGQPVSWAFGSDKLAIHADAGEMLNASYSRWGGGLNFYHATDLVTGAQVLSGASGEVVSHEAGHAMLDGIRPGYLSAFSPDPGGFHESFGDMVGMLMALQDERSINRVAVQTGGDLSKQNCVAHLGEELGRAINDKVGYNRTGGDWVRNAINTFKWQDPSTLPDSADHEHLSTEVHSFSRLWTGAFYEVLTGIQADNMAKGMSAKDALKATGNEGLKLLGAQMRVAPQGDFTYNQMAQALLQADRESNGGARSALIERVFRDRLILQDGSQPLPAPVKDLATAATAFSPSNLYTSTDGGRVAIEAVTRPVTVTLRGEGMGVFEGARVTTLVDRNQSFVADTQAADRTASSLKSHIQAGRIRFNPPGYEMKPQDYFRADGEPYIGFVRWEDDQMIIERAKVTT